MSEAASRIDLVKLYDRFDNDPELIAQVRDLFVQDAPGRLEKIGKALADGDVEGMVKLAHSLKGVCATIYAEPLRLKALEVELAARSGETATLERAVPQMMDMLRDLTDFLSTLA